MLEVRCKKEDVRCITQESDGDRTRFDSSLRDKKNAIFEIMKTKWKNYRQMMDSSYEDKWFCHFSCRKIWWFGK